MNRYSNCNLRLSINIKLKLLQKFSIIQLLKPFKQENLLNKKEQIIINEMVKYIALDPIKGLLNKDLLNKQEKYLVNLINKIPENYLHSLLLLYVNLLDIFLIRIKNKLQFYKKHYVPLIQKMLNRHGQMDFSRADYELNNQIKHQSKPILGNLTETHDYCLCVLQIFDITGILKSEIINAEYYKIWNLPINRKHEYEDMHTQASEYLNEFLIYRKNKKKAFLNCKISITKNKRSSMNELNEREISLKLENLLDAIKKITIRINENEALNPNVFLAKQSQMREQKNQNTVIDANRPRVPMASNPLDALRRSQSFSDLYTKPGIFSVIKDDSASPKLTESAVSRDTHLSFFIFESESQNQKNEEEKQFLVSASKRRISL